MTKTSFLSLLYLVFIGVLFFSCSSPHKKEQALYKQHCASCHIAPAINSLPKTVWDSTILPEMAARMGIKEEGYNPYKGLSFQNQLLIKKSGIYPGVSAISEEDWNMLRAYIIQMAPDSLPDITIPKTPKNLSLFAPKKIAVDSFSGAYITYLEYEKESSSIRTGTISGVLSKYLSLIHI